MQIQDTQPARAQRVLKTHREIFAAIRARDPERAAHLMRAHGRAMRASPKAAAVQLKGAANAAG